MMYLCPDYLKFWTLDIGEYFTDFYVVELGEDDDDCEE
jgi:hypothetical protein